MSRRWRPDERSAAHLPVGQSQLQVRWAWRNRWPSLSAALVASAAAAAVEQQQTFHILPGNCEQTTRLEQQRSPQYTSLAEVAMQKLNRQRKQPPTGRISTMMAIKKSKKSNNGATCTTSTCWLKKKTKSKTTTTTTTTTATLTLTPTQRPLVALLLIISVSLLAVSSASIVTSGSGATTTTTTGARNGNASTFGDLVAIGATSLQMEPQQQQQRNGSSNRFQQQRMFVSDRLVDQLGELSSTGNDQKRNQQQQFSKLDYIIDFMQSNKLSKFCDLLTNSQPEIRALNEQLNSLNQFTLFVPTNEAMLLMQPQLLQQQAAAATAAAAASVADQQVDNPTSDQQQQVSIIKQFLLSHATSELVVPTISISGRQTRWSQRNSYQQQRENPQATSTLPVNQQQQSPEQSQPNQQVSGASSSLIYSLAGSPLRVNTVPANAALQVSNGGGSNGTTGGGNSLAQQSSSSSSSSSTKLELIVNGANILSGQSYALQEPNNSSATYAIVHLIDRSLFPPPEMTLINKLRQLVPTFAKYLDLAQDRWLSEALESSRSLFTLFLPNEDAFKATPVKLLNQLDTNRTFLLDFLRSHLVDGLYYSAQLTGGNVALQSTATSGQVHLSAISGAQLEFESKTLQSRQLVLVNAVPILEADIMTLNGVIHLISRPLFPRDLLNADCHCTHQTTGVNNQTTILNPPGSSNRFQLTANQQQQVANLTEAAIYDKLWPRSSFLPEETPSAVAQWPLQRQPAPVAVSNNELTPVGSLSELERDESQLIAGASTGGAIGNSLTRSQRSGIVARNNRDFYRPSAAPANLLLVNKQQQQQQPRVDSTQPPPPVTSNTEQIFDAERYKVLNASSRQRQSRISNFAAERLSESPSNSLPQFHYDRVLTSPASAPVAGSATDQFNQLLPPTEATTVFRRPYSVLPSANLSNWATGGSGGGVGSSEQVVASSGTPVGSNQQSQRVIKFQPEDARDPLPTVAGSRLANWTRIPATSGQAAQQPPVYELIPQQTSASGRSSLKQQVATNGGGSGKTLAPPALIGSCAFYDAECKRLVARLVHLPSIRRNKSQQDLAQNSSYLHSSSISPVEQHLDSTFGETTESPHLGGGFTQSMQKSNAQANLATTTLSPLLISSRVRVSPLNQPLPPWNDEELYLRTGGGGGGGATSGGSFNSVPVASTGWRSAQDRDITRIAGAATTGGGGGKASNNLLQQQQQQQLPTRPPAASSAQILLVPVKMLQETVPSLTAQINNLTSQQFSSSTGANNQQQQQQRANQQQQQQQQVFFNSNQQYHTPTPYSVSPVTTHMPLIFSSSSLSANNNNNHLSSGKLSNFTTLELFPSSESDHSFPVLNNSAQQRAKKLNNRLQQQDGHHLLRAPSAHRKQQLAQVQIDNNGTLGANFELNPTSGIKQARKLIRLQQQQQQQQVPLKSADYFSAGDMSITSAKLSSSLSNNNYNQLPLVANLSEGLASYASNQALDVSTNFVRSAPPAIAGTGGSSTTNDQQAAAAAAAASTSSDFFQNRTIGEIMDDSGLRIDNQQVTFARLKECLADAELLSLITQTGSALSIFMPTDTAFQRLVQQQAVAHQRDSRTGGGGVSGGSTGERSSGAAARLLSSSSADSNAQSNRRTNNNHLLPLVARRTGATRATSGRLLSGSESTGASSTTQLNSLEASSGDSFNVANAAERLTLDCASKQVRQILLDHLSARLITPKQLQTDMAITSLSGRQLLLSSVPSKKIVVVDGQPVIAATRAKNGMVYVINKFLNLTKQVPNVVDLIESQSNLSTFLSYLSFSSLADRLKRDTGPLTILAPTNEAFEQLSGSARQLLNSDPAALMDVLRGHIVEGAQFGKLISMRNKLKTMNADQSIEAKVVKPNLYLLDNQMTAMRLVGTTGNGVVNSIDRLIVPQWLKVSMGAKPLETLPVPVNTARDSQVDNGRSSSSSSAALNLPNISNQPVRFEQPSGNGNRLFSNSQSAVNSFMLTNNNNNNNSSNFDAFDSNSTATTMQSPFLRVANSLSNEQQQPTSTSATTTGGGGGVAQQNSKKLSKNSQLVDKLANLMQARKFTKYLFKSKVIEQQLKADMNYVILVPTDSALEKLPKQILEMLDRDQERLVDLINYHILDTTFEYINTIPDGQTLNTLNEKDIVFNWHRNNTVLTASGAVVLGGIQEENIALLIVDRVLYPTPGNILNIISKSPILSNFTSLIRNAHLEEQLSLAGPYTLFAPSDYAFNQLAKGEIEFLNRNRESARRFLLRHLSQPAVFTSSIALSGNATGAAAAAAAASGASNQQVVVPTMIVSNSLGEDLTLRQRNDYFSVNEVNFSYADVAATNGVVHVIDGLL